MLKKSLVLISLLVLGVLFWGVRETVKTPKSFLVSSKNYSGMLYEIENRDDRGVWFTVLVNEEKAVRRLNVAYDMVTGLNISDLKVGDGVLLTVQIEGDREEVVDVLKQDNPLLGTLTGKVVSFSEKRMVLSWYENEISVNMGEMAKYSVKYDKETNTPGTQIEVSGFSRMKVGDAVVVGIDRVASSENLVINSVQVLN